MKLICLFILPVLFYSFLISCTSSEIRKSLSKSDSVVINFNSERSDTIIKTVSATEKKAINKMLDFVDSKAAEGFKCGYDGNLTFFSNGQPLLPVVFKYKEASCRHFLFEFDGKLMSNKLSNEAADFLESLEKGNNQY